jgi:adenosine kinase
MKFPGYFKDHILPEHLDCLSLSFLVESMVRQPGGIAPNIAYTMALLGEHPRLFATAGEDFESYRQWLEAHGIDASRVRIIPGELTASFFANTDLANSQIASFYTGAMAHAGDYSLIELVNDLPDLVVISPNAPQAMIRYPEECKELHVDYIYDPSQQIPRLDDEQLRRGIEGARALFVNHYEFLMIQNRLGMSIEDLTSNSRFVVITHGEHGIKTYYQDIVLEIPAVVPTHVADPTGVGDAFRGGFLAGYARGWNLLTCTEMGAVAATYCLEHPGPQGHAYTPKEFVERFRLHFHDEGELDELVIE